MPGSCFPELGFGAKSMCSKAALLVNELLHTLVPVPSLQNANSKYDRQTCLANDKQTQDV